MNLEALALRRAEEQMTERVWRRPDPEDRPPVAKPIRVVPPLGRKSTVSCVCGSCKRCKGRAWMAAYRAGLRPHRFCFVCGHRITSSSRSGWCSNCQRNRPKQFRAWMGSLFFDGGGI